MGKSSEVPPQMIVDFGYLKKGDFDEKPLHKVKISKSFYISTKEITIEEFKKFRESYVGSKEYYPYAYGISWDEDKNIINQIQLKQGKPII